MTIQPQNTLIWGAWLPRDYRRLTNAAGWTWERKMDNRRREPIPGDVWRTAGSKPAGLYGELPPLPAQPTARPAIASRSPSKAVALD